MGIPEIREVSVTPRLRLGRDFIAPDMAPVSTHALESEKGLRGWSDYETPMPAVAVNGGLIVGKVERELDEITAGSAMWRRAKSRGRVMNTMGPSRGK